MDLNTFGSNIGIEVAQNTPAITIDIIAPLSLNYIGNEPTEEVIEREVEALRVRVNAFYAEQLTGWTKETMGKKLISSQKVNDAQATVDKLVETTSVYTDDYENGTIRLSVNMPVGIIIWGDKPMEVLREEYNKLRAKVNRVLVTALRKFVRSVNRVPVGFDIADLGLDALFTEPETPATV